MAITTHDTPTVPRTLTTGEIAREAGGDRWQVLACIRRGLLADPPGRVGVFRIWAPADLARVVAALQAGGYLPCAGAGDRSD